MGAGTCGRRFGARGVLRGEGAVGVITDRACSQIEHLNCNLCLASPGRTAGLNRHWREDREGLAESCDDEHQG